MKAVIQRVQRASVQIEGQSVAQIESGILTLLGVEQGDNESICEKMINKILELRIFEDQNGKMNLSLKDTGKAHLIVSQFTLAADCNSGKRPSFSGAEKPEKAKKLYEYAIEYSKKTNTLTLSGVFQANMQLELINDGPATFILEIN